VIAVDATSVILHGDGATVTPSGAVAVAVDKGLSGCKDAGTLPTLTSGTHEVQLFRDGKVAATARLSG